MTADETKLRAVVDHAINGIITINEQGIVESFNPACEKLFGYQAGEVIGRNVKMLMPEPYHGEHDGYLTRYITTHEARIIGTAGREVSGKRKDGSTFPMELSVCSFELEDGRHFSGIIHDITARKAAEESNGLLAAIVESSDDAIIGKSLNGVIRSWNKGAERLFGYSAEEAVGKHISLIIPPNRLDEEHYIIAQLYEGKSTEHFETVRLCKDGQTIDISLTVSPIRNTAGKIIGASKVARDITARKIVEKQLQAAHKYLEDMLNHIPDPIFMKDREHRWIGGNKAFWKLMDGPPEKFIGKSDYEFFPKEEADVFWEQDDKVLNSGQEYTNEEFFTDSTGIRHVLSTKKIAFRNEKEEIFLVGIIHDITDIKEAEASLLRYMKALEHSNKELDDFAYIASHDLKEPLRGIHNHAGFLLEDNKGKLDKESIRKLNRLVYLSRRMERLVNDLLYFSRLGRENMAIQATDIRAVLDDIENTLDVFLADHKARIVVPGHLPTITCDKPRVSELFRNLITNAVKYNDKPEKTVEIGFLPAHPSPQGERYHNVFYVKDDGKGIAPEFHEEIFRIFKRLENGAGAQQEGTGVGLTFVKKIVERHGGKIWLESKLGQETVFYFTLQSADASPEKQPKAQAA